ncbi:uncharacterized protein CC84DRAFT_273594 [Paraphaeosphaeria sporulosa]|uniref:Uncharacterized protein n=1 Tax=Paraphaeosphaeria sporulosa TaxID=1460663 RepID=A0A177C2J1_9PLEO|nr:uncharacterized protein CC84DRAFT_273594 [Paraphaeosphaeria sporulosa]OAG00957.1 hypothetical protein CC84DRAFT_273594 [Paraphaeosphaeria sporulosa]
MEIGRRGARQCVEQSESERQSRLVQPTRQHKARPVALIRFLTCSSSARNRDNPGEERCGIIGGPFAETLIDRLSDNVTGRPQHPRFLAQKVARGCSQAPLSIPVSRDPSAVTCDSCVFLQLHQATALPDARRRRMTRPLPCTAQQQLPSLHATHTT